ncbi:MAG TPA: EAL domain-containing protein, partial [Sphaerochaeta sp.]|nr:EAL domain-containing protein [Sphaerochaeta sp.]
MKHQYQIQPAILIAGAESQNRTELYLQLSEEYTILEAENTPQMLRFLETEDISAILYDDTFPGFSSGELLQLKKIPTFLFSDQQDTPHFTGDGPTFLFTKPYDMKLLKEQLRSIAHTRQLRSGPAGATPLKKGTAQELSLWSINACELQKGFALYTYRENKSTPIYVDESFLALGGVGDLQAFREKYPDVNAFIREQHSVSFNEKIQKAMEDHSSFSFSIEMKSNANHGSELFFYASWIPYPGLSDPVFSVMVLDSTQLVENQRELFALIERDSLTGIYNQETFYRKTEALLKGNPDTPYLFIRWNIERFKTVNDLFGNSAGNAILKSLGESFSILIGKRGTYGRLYSDQFALCIPKEGFDATLFAKSVEEQLNTNNLKAYVRSVFGIYEIIDPSMGISLMSDRANMALNTAKGNYQRPFAYYTDPLRKKLLKEQAIVNEMRKALDLGQFQIFLQPFFSITENRFTGAEALVRWIHPERGIIGPDAFVPLFEENGFIIPLDDHIIEQVCILQRRILDEGRPTVPIAVNLSRSDFYNQDLAKNIIEKTDRYNIPHALLMFEITESVYSENPKELLKVMRTLQDEGFLILMDDFGSGYSSLNILMDVPIDILKLDSMFSREIGASSRAEKIIRSIVNMASLLELPLVIEGIETREQVDFYRLLGCNTLQGFYFSRPLPVEQFLTLDLVHHRPAFITDQLFQHMGSFSLSEIQSRVLKTLFDEIYLFNYTDDRYQQLYN